MYAGRRGVARDEQGFCVAGSGACRRSIWLPDLVRAWYVGGVATQMPCGRGP